MAGDVEPIEVDLERIAKAVREILIAVGEDPDRDGLVRTPDRVARMYEEIFAGLREDPFFFDVESFFRVRAAVLGLGPAASLKPASTAPDFTAGYNVNSIVVRVPLAFLQNGDATRDVFDVWETISVRN